ncbi:hypothetical protein ACU5EH_17495 [Aliivibrio salmonicida]|uniref:hypothetical protein n=1 Tax=Aliivibrio salmonicida TaxID=40269 RepID=UPI00406CF318
MSNSSIYIKKISIADHPYIKTKNFSIGSDTNTKRNIIITGKNGCGKSSLLLSLKGHIQSHSSNRMAHINHYFQAYQQTVEQLKKFNLERLNTNNLNNSMKLH